jgi:hypothetical protein
MEKIVCEVCKRKTHHKSNIPEYDRWECSHVECPHRRSCSSDGPDHGYLDSSIDLVNISERQYNG